MAFFNLKPLLKSKYFRKSLIIKSLYLLPTKITVAHFDVKPVFRPNLALLKGPKWSFGQIWTYLIWPNLVWDSHSAHNQYLVSRFLGEFRVLNSVWTNSKFWPNRIPEYYSYAMFDRIEYTNNPDLIIRIIWIIRNTFERLKLGQIMPKKARNS